MSIILSRVDERMVHGRVINDWIAEINPSHLVIVDDALTEDNFMSKIYAALVPIWLNTEILTCFSAVRHIKAIDTKENRIFILARTPQAFVALIKGGVSISEITFADKKYFKNKLKIQDTDKRAINRLIDNGVNLYAINTPLERKTPIEKFKIEE